MTLKQFEQLIERLQHNGQRIYEDWLKENGEMISYNAWEKRVIVNAVKDYQSTREQEIVEALEKLKGCKFIGHENRYCDCVTGDIYIDNAIEIVQEGEGKV